MARTFDEREKMNCTLLISGSGEFEMQKTGLRKL